MKAYTEVQNYIRRFTSLTPENDITVIEGKRGKEIFSIGNDSALYLTYEDDGNSANFSRKKILEKIKKFAAVKMNETNPIVIAVADEINVYLAITKDTLELKKEDFIKINLDGVLRGKKLIPSNLLIAALDQGITLFIEMRDNSGRIEQFACVLDSANPRAIKYYPLASNYSFVYCSIAGRAIDQYVDGIYTCGEYGGTKQLLYTPSHNIFGESQPAPLRLKNDFNVETICTLALKKETGTHLFAIGNGSLYFYPFDRQRDLYHMDHPEPDFCISSNLFLEAKKAQAILFGDHLYIYVLNESNQLSYTIADYKNEKPSNFKEPVTLYNNVFYFDLSCKGTLNICTAETALFGDRDCATGCWTFREAYIETSLDQYKTFSAYVTKVDTSVQNGDIIVNAKAKEKMTCYVNGIYHHFLTLSVKSDATGYITVIQEATDMNPDCFEVLTGTEKLLINPAEEMQKKILSLNNAEKAKNEVINYPDGKQVKLFENISNDDLQVITAGISALSNAGNSLMPNQFNFAKNFANGLIIKISDKIASILPYEVTHNPFVSFIAEIVKDLEYAFNWVMDKLRWLYEHTLKPVVDFVIAKVQNVWKFIVKIGEKILEVVIDAVETVFSTLKKFLELIGIPIDKIIDWFKKALNIDQSERQNNVLKKMIQLSGAKLAEQSYLLKDSVMEKLNETIDFVTKWSEIDFSNAKSLTSKMIQNKNAFTITPQNTYMFDTLLGGINFDEIIFPEFEAPPQLKTALEQLNFIIKDQKSGLDTLIDMASSIALSIEGIFESKDVFDVCKHLKQILGKVVITGLEVCKSFIGLVMDAVNIALETILKIFTQPIHIPFISNIVKIFGIKEFSIIDLFTFPLAFLITNGSILATGKPLIQDHFYRAVMNAQTLDDLRRANFA